MKKRKSTWKKIIGICGVMLLALMPFKVLASEMTTYPTYYEDGTTSPVMRIYDESGSEILYANGTSLIFKDGEMYQDLAPLGEFNNTDRRIYLSEDRSSEALDRLRVNTGGVDDTVYGDCYMTFLNTDMLGLYVKHITDITVYMDNSLVLTQRIENADGDVNYILKNVTDFDGIEIYDNDIASEEMDGGLIKGSLNITLENVRGGDVRGCDGVIETSGTVLGDTRVSIKNCLLGHVEPARVAGSETKPAKVSVNVESSEVESISVATWGSFGTPGTIYGDVDVFVKDSNIELGIYRYATNKQGGGTNTVTGKATVRVEDSTIRDINDRGGYSNEESISENTSVSLKNVEVEDLVTNSVSIEGTVKYVRLTVNNLNFVNNATLISDQQENNGSTYIRNQISGTGTLKANVKETSQYIYFEGENPVAKDTKITIEPVHLEENGYVLYGKNEKLGGAIELRFNKNTKATSYLANFICVNHELNELLCEAFSEITVLDYCEMHNYKLAKTSGYVGIMYHAGLYDREADCTHEGLTTYYCSNCDKITYEKTKALGHAYEKNKVVKPTSTEKGYTLYKCTRCGDTYKDDYVDPLKSIAGAKVTLNKTSYYYDKKAKKPSVTVTLNGTTLKSGTDYTVTYKNNKNIGTATVTISGKGNYTGTITSKFTIKVKKGYAFTSSKIKYEVTGTSTVKCTGIDKSASKTITIPKSVKCGGKTFNVTSIASKALKGNTKVTKVTIGSNVTTIGASAFAGCTKLTTVTIGSKVKTIGTSAFEGCKKLTKVTIGSAVTTIGTKAFKNCKALKSITIPSKVTKIDKQAFYNCKNLKTITIKSTKLKTVGKESFKKIYAKATIKVPKVKATAYKKLLKEAGVGSKVKYLKMK